METQVFHFGQVPLQLTQSAWPEKQFIDLSIVSLKFTKKYFVKKVFNDKMQGLTSTCEFCYEKMETKNQSTRSLSEQNAKLCDECHLCFECSQKIDKDDFDKKCNFCVERKVKEAYKWKTTGAPHENSILLMKEESFMDLNKKYISKISIVRPFRVDFYTFILFKSEKQVNSEKINLNSGNKTDDLQKSAALKDSNLKKSVFASNNGESEKSSRSTKSSPFELNLNKTISLEKLQFEMKKWDLVGIPGGLWSLKNSFDLFKDKLLLGGCPQGIFRMFSIRKSKCQLTQKLHEYCIEEVIVAISGIIMTKDVSGIVKISMMEERHSKPQLTPLISLYHSYNEQITFLNFAPEQWQLFYYVSQFDDSFQFKVFDSLNNAKLLIDVHLPREKQVLPNDQQVPTQNFAKLEFIDLSFGFLNAIITVQTLEQTNQYYLSTFSFEGVPLTQFTLALQEDNQLKSFQLFKDSFFKDFLVAISVKGKIIFGFIFFF